MSNLGAMARDSHILCGLEDCRVLVGLMQSDPTARSTYSFSGDHECGNSG